MDRFYNNLRHQRTKVTILATLGLVRDYLKVLLESERELSVLDIAESKQELLEKISQNNPSVVLICLMDNEGNDLDLVTDLFRVAPQSKIVILSSPNSLLDQPAALKLGVTGIVGTNQPFRVLIRAIRQVSEGEIWLNQKLIAQLLGGSFYAGNDKSKTSAFYKVDNLTNREMEVISMVGLGMSNKEISKNLFISTATVRHHLSSIYGKLNIEDRLNLAIYAYREKIVQPPAKSF
jgi:two-component system response regulator DegU